MFFLQILYVDSSFRMCKPPTQNPKSLDGPRSCYLRLSRLTSIMMGHLASSRGMQKKDIWNHDHCSVLFSVFLLQKIWIMLHYPRLNYAMLSQFYSCQTQFLCNQNGGRASVEQASWSVLNNCSSKTKHARVQGCSDLAIFLLPLQYLNMFCSSQAHCGNANWVD